MTEKTAKPKDMDDVLRRMLAAPPEPHVAKPPPKAKPKPKKKPAK
jgi:hypothetical protein